MNKFEFLNNLSVGLSITDAFKNAIKIWNLNHKYKYNKDEFLFLNTKTCKQKEDVN